MICAILAIVSRVFLAFDMYPPRSSLVGDLEMSYLSFLTERIAFSAGRRQLVPQFEKSDVTRNATR